MKSLYNIPRAKRY